MKQTKPGNKMKNYVYSDYHMGHTTYYVSEHKPGFDKDIVCIMSSGYQDEEEAIKLAEYMNTRRTK